MPIISTKRLRQEVGAIVRAELEDMHSSIVAQIKIDAALHISDVQYEMLQDSLLLAQGRNQELAQANRELISTVTALRQILGGQAHEALRLALDSVVEKCKVNVS